MPLHLLTKTVGQRLLLCAFLAFLSVTNVKAHESDNPKTPDKVPDFDKKHVTFFSGKNKLSGVLYVPHESNQKTVTVIGPVGYVKEQAPTLYAQALVAKGYTALVFDSTYHGESEGLPRRFESGQQKTRDIIASVDFLAQQPFVDPQQIYGLGICQGVNWMARATNQDKRIQAVSLVAGHYLHPEVAKKYNGGEDRLNQLLKKAQEAKTQFEQTGKVDYIPIVGSPEEDSLLSAPAIYDWYVPWENNINGKGGYWENRITRMSVLDIWGGNAEADLKELNKRTLMIHSNKAASGPVIPKKLFSVIPADKKKLVWFEDQFQTLFYDDMPTINRAAKHIDQWFSVAH